MVQFLRINIIFELNQILKTYSVWVEVDSKYCMIGYITAFDIAKINHVPVFKFKLDNGGL